MEKDEKDFIKKVNMDKAKNKTLLCLILSIQSLITYIIPLIFGNFDFGMIFEILTLIFIIIARKYMADYCEDNAKKFIIFSIIPIGWLFIYDVIGIVSSIEDVIDFSFMGIDLIFQESFIMLNLLFLYLTNKDLNKADNPEKYQKSTDWFYEKLDK